MLDNFGMHEQAQVKKTLTEDLDKQWQKAFAIADEVKTMAAKRASLINNMESSALILETAIREKQINDSSVSARFDQKRQAWLKLNHANR